MSDEGAYLNPTLLLVGGSIVVAGMVAYYFTRSSSSPSSSTLQSTPPKSVARTYTSRSEINPDVTVYSEINSIWSKPLSRVPTTFTDLPRLIKRIQLIPSEDSNLSATYSPDFPKKYHGLGKTNEETIVTLLVSFIVDVVTELETDQEVKDNFARELAWLAEKGGGGDMALTLSLVVQRAKTEDTATLRLFKALQQHIVIPLSFYIKNKLSVGGSDLLTRDMHAPESWRIIVDFSQRNMNEEDVAEGVVTVTHIRRERSTSYKEDEYFEIEWEIVMVFDADIQNMTSATFKIREVSFNDNTNDETKQKILKPLENRDIVYINRYT